jgi:hypothetical protein
MHKITDDSIAAVVELLVSLLQRPEPAGDIIVKLSCTQTLEALLHREDHLPVVHALLPHCESLLQSLYSLVGALEEIELRSQAMSLVRTVVETIGPKLRPFVYGLAAPLPELWTLSGVQNPLLSSVLTTLASLVCVSGGESNILYPIVLPVLRDALQDPSEISFLLNDVLHLWLAIARNATVYTEELDGLSARVPSLLIEEVLTDDGALRDLCLVAEALALVGGGTFLHRQAHVVQELQVRLLAQVPFRATQYVVRGAHFCESVHKKIHTKQCKHTNLRECMLGITRL